MTQHQVLPATAAEIIQEQCSGVQLRAKYWLMLCVCVCVCVSIWFNILVSSVRSVRIVCEMWLR
jgi:hypothetical protein